jgi:hypothetical protein
MTDLTEACADLRAWLPVAAALITQPDTQPAIGRTQPGSKPPWNTAVACVVTDIHAGVRELEQDFRYQVTGRYATRGGSDANTAAAIDAICRLAEALDQAMADQATRLLNRYITQVMMLPAIDLEQRWRTVPGPCPRCTRPMLRYREGDHMQPAQLACLGCARKARMMPGTVSDGIVEWEDGTIT